MARPVVVSKRLTLWPTPGEASHFPSRLNANLRTTLDTSPPVQTIRSPVVRSQIFTTPSEQAAATRLPSGLYVTSQTVTSGSTWKELSSRPVVASQIFTLPSQSAEASRLPSTGLNATPVTELVWPTNVWRRWPVAVSQSL